MMKMILTLALCLQISNVALAQVEQGNDKGNGGGGVFQDGRYMTFGSAGVGVYVDRNELTTDQVPQLKYVMDLMMTSPYINVNTGSRYVQALATSSSRKYYNVQNSKFTSETRARLLGEFSRLTNLDASKLALFAITDTVTKTTYILPEFYKLRPTEQAAIIFHEGYWIVNPDSTYQQVVDAEISFQRYLENMSSNVSLMAWLEKIMDPNQLLSTAFVIDNQNGVFNAVSKKGKIRVGVILGEQGLNCIKNSGAYDCHDLMLNSVYQVSKNYPNSITIKMITNWLLTGKNIGISYPYQSNFSIKERISGREVLDPNLSLSQTTTSQGLLMNNIDPKDLNRIISIGLDN